MSLFFKAHEELITHPKFLKVGAQRYGKEAIGGWFIGACWCAGHLSDGFFPDDARRYLRITPKTAALLVDAGLWEERLDGFQYHDWLDHNPSKESILQAREGSARRAAKSRRNAARAATIDTDIDTDRDIDQVPSEGIQATRSLTPDRQGAWEHMGEWFLEQGQARPRLVGKALDEFAARAAEVANVHEVDLRTAVHRLCEAAEAAQDGKPFAFRVRDCPVPKPAVNIYEQHDQETRNG